MAYGYGDTWAVEDEPRSGLEDVGTQAGSSLMGLLGGPFGMVLMSLAPSLLGGLFRRGDPQRKARQIVAELMDPWNIRKVADEEFGRTLQSPGYSMARTEIMQGGQNAINLLNTSIGQRGLGKSGVGLAMPAATTAGVGLNLGKLSAAAWEAAQQRAFDMQRSKAGLLAGMPTEPNYGARLFGAGMNALTPWLMDYFDRKRNPTGTSHLWAPRHHFRPYDPVNQGWGA